MQPPSPPPFSLVGFAGYPSAPLALVFNLVLSLVTAFLGVHIYRIKPQHSASSTELDRGCMVRTANHIYQGGIYLFSFGLASNDFWAHFFWLSLDVVYPLNMGHPWTFENLWFCWTAIISWIPPCQFLHRLKDLLDHRRHGQAVL